MTLKDLDQAFSEMTEKVTLGSHIRKDAALKVKHEATTDVGGFQVTDPQRAAKAAARYVAEMKSYALSRAQLIKDLKKAGIDPLATLPADDWKTLCQESKLFDFRTYDGNLLFSAGDAKNAYADTAGVVTVILAGAVLLGSLALGYIGLEKFWLAAAFSLTCLGGYCCFASQIYKALLIRYGNSLAKNYDFLKRFMRDGRESLYIDEVRVKVRLPEPPADVVAILSRLLTTSFNRVNAIRVAAVPQALAFSPSLGKVMYDMKVRDDEAARRAADLDPIVYVTYEGVVAIVAQFGDFPIEQALIDRLTKEEVVEMPY